MIFLLSPLQLKHKLRDFLFFLPPFKLLAPFSPFFVPGLLSSGMRLPSLEADGKTTARQTIKLSATQPCLNGGSHGRDSGIPTLSLWQRGERGRTARPVAVSPVRPPPPGLPHRP